MPHFFSNKRLILLMVSIIVLVVLVGLTLREREQLTMPEQFMKDTTAVVQSVFQRPAYFVRGLYDDATALLNVYEENEKLKEQLNDYALISAELEGLRQENASLLELQEASESLSDYGSTTAFVIERQPDRWTETIGINRGSQHGIERDMAVITPQGLIGRVQHTSAFTSQVQLLSDGDRTNRVSAKVVAEEEDDSPIYAFLEGWDYERDSLVLRKIDSEAEIEPGQMVTTSGLGGLFPGDLPIGEITEVDIDEYGLTLNAYVEPSADYYNIEHVLVIERGSPALNLEEDEDENDEEAIDLEEGSAD